MTESGAKREPQDAGRPGQTRWPAGSGYLKHIRELATQLVGSPFPATFYMTARRLTPSGAKLWGGKGELSEGMNGPTQARARWSQVSKSHTSSLEGGKFTLWGLTVCVPSQAMQLRG